MTYGQPDKGVEPLPLEGAAAAMGIKFSTARHYFGHPRARAYYFKMIEDLRDRERAHNVHKAVEIRDDQKMDDSAAGRRVQVEAMRFLEQRDGPANVNVNVGVGVDIWPGYVVAIPGAARRHARSAPTGPRKSRGHRADGAG